MCNLSQGILERGVRQGREEGLTEDRAEGRAEGRVETLYELVQKGFIQIENAARELNISPAEMEEDMAKRGYKIPMSV